MEPINNPKEAPSEPSGASVVFTIYCHVHRESGRRYVGQTQKTVLQRWNQHVYTSTKLVKKGWSYFANAIRKYGKDAFDHEVLETCVTVEQANSAEERWIAHFQSDKPMFGFNIKRGGDHIPHPIRNPWDRPEYREKASAASRRKWQDPEFRVRHAESLKDVYSDPEYRVRMSESMKAVASTPEGLEQRRLAAPVGRVLSEEHRARISASSRCKDPDVRTRISEATRAAMADPELQARIREGHAAAMARPEVKARIAASNKNTGKKLSPETRARISVAMKASFERRRATTGP